MERGKTCTFTGHRPEKLPWRSQEAHKRCIDAKAAIYEALEQMYQRGYRHFICGMARGGDTFFGEAVLMLRMRKQDVTLEAAVPCPGQAKRWSEAEQMRYQNLLEQCNFQTVVCQEDSRESMLRRNEYMVSKSGAIIALYDGGGSGGTMRTLRQAMREGLEQIIITP